MAIMYRVLIVAVLPFILLYAIAARFCRELGSAFHRAAIAAGIEIDDFRRHWRLAPRFGAELLQAWRDGCEQARRQRKQRQRKQRKRS